MKIILIGFMGAGKTSVARELSSLLSLPVLENDELVLSKVAFSSIKEFIDKEGEAAFRRVEKEAFATSLGQDAIFSTGGGIVESEENRSLIFESGATTIYLDAAFESICKRLDGDGDRPLFRDREAAKVRYEKRDRFYRELADIIIPTDSLSIAEVGKAITAMLGISKERSSKRYLCLAGDPVAYSLSPRIHNAAFVAEGLSDQFLYCAIRVRAQSVVGFTNQILLGPFLGASCTMPLKEEVTAHLHSCDDATCKIGAVNTIVKVDEKLIGKNTDWIGIISPLKQRVELKGKKVAVLGAGGTARAALYGLKKEGAEITIFNRSSDSARSLAERFDTSYRSLDEIEQVTHADIILNTTSVGMAPNDERSLVPKDCFSSHQIVMDAIYKPAMTKMLQEASDAGATVVPGIELFVAQAIAQFEIWTGKSAPTKVMASAVCGGIVD